MLVRQLIAMKSQWNEERERMREKNRNLKLKKENAFDSFCTHRNKTKNWETKIEFSIHAFRMTNAMNAKQTFGIKTIILA